MRCTEFARVSRVPCHAFDLGISMSLSQPYRAAMLVTPSSPVWKQIFQSVGRAVLTFRPSHSSTPPPEATRGLAHWWSELFPSPCSPGALPVLKPHSSSTMAEGFLTGKGRRQCIITIGGQTWVFRLSCVSTSRYLGPSVLPYSPLHMGDSTTKA